MAALGVMHASGSREVESLAFSTTSESTQILVPCASDSGVS